ncbi:MAG: hypothetical protein ACYCT0_07050 [Sulfobacillus sp.]
MPIATEAGREILVVRVGSAVIDVQTAFDSDLCGPSSSGHWHDRRFGWPGHAEID